MGALGSKTELSKVVAIYGYNSNEFPWKNIDNRTVYQSNGIIVEFNSKKFVITTRSRMIYCKNIVMYYNLFDETDTVIRNNLHILFQSIEFNLVILGTVDMTELDLQKGEIISGNVFSNLTVKPHNFESTYIAPTMRSNYHVVRMDMDLDSDKINYNVHIYDAKFKGMFIENESFLPSNLFYKFGLINNKKTKIPGLNGAIVFNKKQKLIGMIMISKSQNISYVLPTKAIHKIFMDFYEFFSVPDHNNSGFGSKTGTPDHNNSGFGSKTGTPDNYKGLITIPFEYVITTNSNIKIINKLSLETPNGKKIIKSKDKLISIDHQPVLIDNDVPSVLDLGLKHQIPIDIYLRWNFNQTNIINIELMRNGKLIMMDVFGVPLNQCIFPLTSQPSFNPKTINYVNLNGIIIVQLTHEILDIIIMNKMDITNDIIEGMIDITNNNSYEKYFIIIDCIDTSLANKHGLPCLKINDNKTIKCPLVMMIDNNKINSLNEIQQMIDDNGSNHSYKLFLSFNGENIFEFEL
jgi:hypothetical protein